MMRIAIMIFPAQTEGEHRDPEKRNTALLDISREVETALRKPGRLVGIVDPTRADRIDLEVEL